MVGLRGYGGRTRDSRARVTRCPWDFHCPAVHRAGGRTSVRTGLNKITLYLQQIAQPVCLEVGAWLGPAHQVTTPAFGRRGQQPIGETWHQEVQDAREVCDPSGGTVNRSVGRRQPWPCHVPCMVQKTQPST